MSVAFDTLKLARKLESAGFSRDQANGAAEALAETLTAELVSKHDLTLFGADVKTALAGIQGEMAALRASTAQDIAALRASSSQDIAALRATTAQDIAALRAATAQWIISAVLLNFAGLLGVALALWQALKR